MPNPIAVLGAQIPFEALVSITYERPALKLPHRHEVTPEFRYCPECGEQLLFRKDVWECQAIYEAVDCGTSIDHPDWPSGLSVVIDASLRYVYVGYTSKQYSISFANFVRGAATLTEELLRKLPAKARASALFGLFVVDEVWPYTHSATYKAAN